MQGGFFIWVFRIILDPGMNHEPSDKDVIRVKADAKFRILI